MTTAAELGLILLPLLVGCVVLARIVRFRRTIRAAGAAGARPPRHLEEKNRG